MTGVRDHDSHDDCAVGWVGEPSPSRYSRTASLKSEYLKTPNPVSGFHSPNNCPLACCIQGQFTRLKTLFATVSSGVPVQYCATFRTPAISKAVSMEESSLPGDRAPVVG